MRCTDSNVLVDCGIFQGYKNLRERNWQPFPYPADSIDAVFLTHAHLDHSGYLPRLVAEGFSGPVYCTRQTAQLCGMHFLPPFVIFGTHQIDTAGISEAARGYRTLLEALAAGEPDETERERLSGSITINGFVERLAGRSA